MKKLLLLSAILTMGMGTLFASGTKDEYLNSYLTIESLSDNDTITLRIPAELTTEQLTWAAYSTDMSNWTTVEPDTMIQRIKIVLNQGDKVYFKGLGKQWTNNNAICRIFGSDDFMVYGNIMSLLYGDDFATQTSLPQDSDSTFRALFHSNDHLVSVENLMLPATTLAPYCYYQLFYSCHSITTGPELPATTLALNCYRGMFYDCTSLTTAPELPATTLASYCYYAMFSGCSALTTPPTLPATTIEYSCYGNMFENCFALATAA